MLPKYFKEMSLKEQIEFLKNIDTLIFDCDGVLWLGTIPIDGAADLLHLLHQNGKNIFYVSNNSSKTLDEYYKKFSHLKFPCSTDMIYITAPLVGDYMKKKLPSNKSVYLVGSPAVSSELVKNGIKNFGHGFDENQDRPEEMNKKVIEEKIPLDENVGAVVVAYDNHFNYTKMTKAASYLKNPDCLFVSTNGDAVFPHPNTSYILPGTGAILKAIEFCVGRKAKHLGKPGTYIANQIKMKHNINPERTMMIGDRCNTDVLFGTRAGFWSMLVLTGVHNLDHVKKFEASDKEDDKMSVPNYYTDSVKDLIPALEVIFKT